MTDVRPQALKDHLIWCRKEHEAALAQIKLFTTGGAKALVQNGDAAPQDITSSVVRHGQEVAEKMSHFLSIYETNDA
jgi:hypothetical protein